METHSDLPMPMDVFTAEKICDACVRAAGNVPNGILAQDPLSIFGIEDPLSLADLCNKIVNDDEIGVPSEGYKIPDPNTLDVQGSTTFSSLMSKVIAASQPDPAASGESIS